MVSIFHSSFDYQYCWGALKSVYCHTNNDMVYHSYWTTLPVSYVSSDILLIRVLIRVACVINLFATQWFEMKWWISYWNGCNYYSITIPKLLNFSFFNIIDRSDVVYEYKKVEYIHPFIANYEIYLLRYIAHPKSFMNWILYV